eukprot:scaffold5075_cov296-Prasinococcus_capsulatus_cf.AAC.5
MSGAALPPLPGAARSGGGLGTGPRERVAAQVAHQRAHKYLRGHRHRRVGQRQLGHARAAVLRAADADASIPVAVAVEPALDGGLA